jgi:hypothetical protein
LVVSLLLGFLFWLSSKFYKLSYLTERSVMFKSKAAMALEDAVVCFLFLAVVIYWIS